jgi:hypothetical protein
LFLGIKELDVGAWNALENQELSGSKIGDSVIRIRTVKGDGDVIEASLEPNVPRKIPIF